LYVNTRELQTLQPRYRSEYTQCLYISGNDFKKTFLHTHKVPKLPV